MECCRQRCSAKFNTRRTLALCRPRYKLDATAMVQICAGVPSPDNKTNFLTAVQALGFPWWISQSLGSTSTCLSSVCLLWRCTQPSSSWTGLKPTLKGVCIEEWNKWKKLTWNFSPTGFRLQMFEVLQLHIWFSWGRLTCFCSGFKRSTVGLLGQLVCAWAKQRQPPLDHSTRFSALNEMQTWIVLGFLILLLDFPT